MSATIVRTVHRGARGAAGIFAGAAVGLAGTAAANPSHSGYGHGHGHGHPNHFGHGQDGYGDNAHGR
jgi:hypothetical protein